MGTQSIIPLEDEDHKRDWLFHREEELGKYDFHIRRSKRRDPDVHSQSGP